MIEIYQVTAKGTGNSIQEKSMLSISPERDGFLTDAQ